MQLLERGRERTIVIEQLGKEACLHRLAVSNGQLELLLQPRLHLAPQQWVAQCCEGVFCNGQADVHHDGEWRDGAAPHVVVQANEDGGSGLNALLFFDDVPLRLRGLLVQGDQHLHGRRPSRR